MCQKLRGNDRLYNYMEVWNENDIDVSDGEMEGKKNATESRNGLKGMRHLRLAHSHPAQRGVGLPF